MKFLELVFVAGEVGRAIDRLHAEMENASDTTLREFAEWAEDQQEWALYAKIRTELASRLREEVERDVQ